MGFAIDIHAIDEDAFCVVDFVGCAMVGDVVHRILEVEPVSERFVAHFDKFFLGNLRRDGVGFVVDGRCSSDDRLPSVKQVAPKMYDTFMNKMGLGEMFKKLGMDYEYAPVKMTGFAIKGNKNV